MVRAELRAARHLVDAVGAQDGLVVFDEAYQPFSSRTWMHKLATHDHVLVLRTLSKFGLAGVRMGYLVGAAPLIEQIDKVSPPYNISGLNSAATLFALEHAEGVTVFPSEANMILVRVPDSKRAFEGLKQRRVLVKHIAGLHPLLANCLRLTVGAPEENTLMIDALKESL